MHPLNWVIVAAWITYVVWVGIRRSENRNEMEAYLVAKRSLPWWAVGLSVMATQLSAVTMIGTTGQGATDGMRFIQFYLGLPLAMVILGVTLVPFLHGAKVYTAYEYLERRFDAKTRSLTAFLFLLSRGLSCGTIIAAPAVVFAAIFGWNIWWGVALIGVPTVIYTMIGGVQAVTWVDVRQMVLIVGALVAVVITLLVQLPVSPVGALRVAGAAGSLRTFDFSFSLTNTYTFWSGLIGGTFLMLSYFGTDQSQVQRYLAAKSVDEARSSLLMSAYWKIPLQALVLLVGVLVFVFYVFFRPPLLFNPAHEATAKRLGPVIYETLDTRFMEEHTARRAAAFAIAGAPGLHSDSARAAALDFRGHDVSLWAVRTEALNFAQRATGQTPRDVNYIIPRFVLEHLPIGLAGLFIAAILAAAMNAIAAELNSLATTTTIDLYRRWIRPEADDAHFLTVTRGATVFWGIFACIVATFAANLGSLIEVVNKFGSFFYGSILGVFLLAMIPRAKAIGAFVGMLAGMVAVGLVTFGPDIAKRFDRGFPTIAFLWLNVVGAVTVVVVGLAVSSMRRGVSPGASAAT